MSNPKAAVLPVAEALAEHQGQHGRQTITHIAQLARQGHTATELLAAFFPT